MEKIKRIYQFKGLSKIQKKDLKKAYFKREWINLLMSYSFIILSSSRPILSSNNGAIYVLAWFTLSILISLHAYVNQSDYMASKKRARKYSKKHKNSKVEEGRTFIPEIGGWAFVGMQMLVASLVYLASVPISLYLQFKGFEIYKDIYMRLFISIFVDTYILAFYNGILQLIIDFINDCSNRITTMKKTVSSLTMKNAICFVGSTIILYKAFSHYFNKEFEGLFGDMRIIIGSIYIIFVLYPLIKSIKQVVIAKNKGLNVTKNTHDAK